MPEDRLNPTSLLYWWPRVLDADVPKPRTEIVWVDPPIQAAEMMFLCEEHGGDRETDGHRDCDDRLTRYVLDISEAVARVDGYPAFLRTDLFSGKHWWETTCHLPKPPNGDGPLLATHVWNLLEAQEMAMFPPSGEDVTVRAFVVRELLKTEPVLSAWNGFPVTPERRYFVDDGKVLCHHAYWSDEENIERGLRASKPVDWRERLASVNEEDAAQIELLTERSKQVADVLPGAWSVDWLQAADGEWYLIDLAVAARSWHPEHA